MSTIHVHYLYSPSHAINPSPHTRAMLIWSTPTAVLSSRLSILPHNIDSFCFCFSNPSHSLTIVTLDYVVLEQFLLFIIRNYPPHPCPPHIRSTSHVPRNQKSSYARPNQGFVLRYPRLRSHRYPRLIQCHWD